jgi:preprotein translocase subunit SecA
MVERFLSAAGLPDDAPIESKMVSNAIKSAQTQVEAQNFEIRKNVLKYDDVMNRQRGVIYGERRLVLEGEDISAQVGQFLADTIQAYVDAATAEGFAEDWDLEKLWTALHLVYPISLTIDGLISEVGSIGGLDAEFLAARIIEDAEAAYVRREAEKGSVEMRNIERKVLLKVLDSKWREHLYEMDYLQEGIGLRAMAQRDPLVEYQCEGYELFAAMMDAIKEELASKVFYAELSDAQNESIRNPSDKFKRDQVTADGFSYPVYSFSSADENGVVTKNEVTRNAPCPCGSRKKYKRCHGAT